MSVARSSQLTVQMRLLKKLINDNRGEFRRHRISDNQLHSTSSLRWSKIEIVWKPLQASSFMGRNCTLLGWMEISPLPH